MKHTRKSFAALAVAAALALSACSGEEPKAPDTSANPTASASGTPSPTRTEFPFKVGAVDWTKFSEEVGTANQAIKTLHVKNTNTLTVKGKTITSLAEGDVDQTDAASPSFSVKLTEGEKGEIITELLSVDGNLYMKRTGESGTDDGWMKYPTNMAANPISTSTSLFKRLADVEGAVKEVKYLEKDAAGHKFTIVIDVKKLAPGNPNAEKAGDVPSTVWLNDDLQVVKQELEVKTPEGDSKVLSEQSNFNKPVEFEAPKDAKDVTVPSATPEASPSASPSPSASN